MNKHLQALEEYKGKADMLTKKFKDKELTEEEYSKALDDLVESYR